MTTFAYIRISTDKQVCLNQRYEIENYAKSNGITIDKFVEEVISSRKPLKERALYKLLKKMKSNDVLITSEVSRLGRNILEIMSILKECLDKDCLIITLKENYRLGSDLQSKVLAFAFGLASEIERQLISQRTKECLKRLKEEGKHIGRPYGKGYRKLCKRHKKIMELLNKRVSKAEIARLMGCSWTTLHRYINECCNNNAQSME